MGQAAFFSWLSGSKLRAMCVREEQDMLRMLQFVDGKLTCTYEESFITTAVSFDEIWQIIELHGQYLDPRQHRRHPQTPL